MKALHNYREINQILPSHIVIYRDGVGEGQLPYVYEHEVEQVKRKLSEIYGDPTSVKMSFIVVTKRINTRLFNRENNPPPGTIVDDIITNPLKYDFFVVSQSVKQGSVSPCAYNVIADSTGWRPDQMQRMTYKLTHMYYNWCGTVKVPALASMPINWHSWWRNSYGVRQARRWRTFYISCNFFATQFLMFVSGTEGLLQGRHH